MTPWLALGLPPLVQLLLIVAASVDYGAVGAANAEAIAARVQATTPTLLVMAQVALLAIVSLAARRSRMTWASMDWRRLTQAQPDPRAQWSGWSVRPL